MRVRAFRDPKGVTLIAGRYAVALNWAPGARFANGSRWCSGWHDWTREP